MTDENRTLVELTDHISYYEDDPLKLLYTDAGNKLNWLKFCSKQFSQKWFSASEQSLTEGYRDIADVVAKLTPTSTEAEIRHVKSLLVELVGSHVGEEGRKTYFQALGIDGNTNGIPKSEAEARARKEAKEAEEKAQRQLATQAQEKKTMTVEPGSSLALAQNMGMPPELADLFFRKIDGKPYIMNPGLLYMAGKVGYQRIEVTDKFDEKKGEWVAESRIYPKITSHLIEAIAKLTPEIQKVAFEEATKPTTGIGTASQKNVQNSRMHTFLREMAQTRSQNRALRAYVGYGATTYEEMPEAEIVRE